MSLVDRQTHRPTDRVRISLTSGLSLDIHCSSRQDYLKKCRLPILFLLLNARNAVTGTKTPICVEAPEGSGDRKEDKDTKRKPRSTQRAPCNHSEAVPSVRSEQASTHRETQCNTRGQDAKGTTWESGKAPHIQESCPTNRHQRSTSPVSNLFQKPTPQEGSHTACFPPASLPPAGCRLRLGNVPHPQRPLSRNTCPPLSTPQPPTSQPPTFLHSPTPPPFCQTGLDFSSKPLTCCLWCWSLNCSDHPPCCCLSAHDVNNDICVCTYTYVCVCTNIYVYINNICIYTISSVHLEKNYIVWILKTLSQK